MPAKARAPRGTATIDAPDTDTTAPEQDETVTVTDIVVPDDAAELDATGAIADVQAKPTEEEWDGFGGWVKPEEVAAKTGDFIPALVKLMIRSYQEHGTLTVKPNIGGNGNASNEDQVKKAKSLIRRHAYKGLGEIDGKSEFGVRIREMKGTDGNVALLSVTVTDRVERSES